MAEEQQSLTNSYSDRRPKGYGAAVPSSPGACQPKSHGVTHTVSKSDSLTSLAIRYGSTVADIKRANKLWNNESLGFRDTVVIPVYDADNSLTASSSLPSMSAADVSDVNIALSSNGAGPDTDISANDFFSMFDDELSTTYKKDSNKAKHKSSATNNSADTNESKAKSTRSKAAKETTNSDGDFFARFDKSLTVLKQKVEEQTAHSDETLAGVGEDAVYGTPVFRDKIKHNGSNGKVAKEKSKRDSHGSIQSTGSLRSNTGSIRSSTDDVRTTPEPVIKSTVTRKLKKHEKRQDELFSL